MEIKAPTFNKTMVDRTILIVHRGKKIMYNVKGLTMTYDRIWDQLFNNIQKIEGQISL